MNWKRGFGNESKEQSHQTKRQSIMDRKRLQTLTLAKEQRRRRLTRVSPPGLPPAVAVRERLQRRRFIGACTVTEWKRSRAAARHAGLRTAARPLDGGALARGRKRAPASGSAVAPPPPFPSLGAVGGFPFLLSARLGRRGVERKQRGKGEDRGHELAARSSPSPASRRYGPGHPAAAVSVS